MLLICYVSFVMVKHQMYPKCPFFACCNKHNRLYHFTGTVRNRCILTKNATQISLKQEFTTFNAALHVVMTSNQKIISLLLLNCSSDNSRNHNVLIWYVTAKEVAIHSLGTSGQEEQGWEYELITKEDSLDCLGERVFIV